MAINRVFGGVNIRVPGNLGGMTTQQRVTMNFRRFLYKLGVKSAGYRSDRVITGTGAVVKLNGKPIGYAQGVTYDVNNIRDLTDDGSKS